MSAAWLTALTALAVVVGGIITFCARWAWRILSRIMRFLDDYFGEPARSGVPERPGVMARLQAVEAAAARAEVASAKVLAETQPNHGHSLRDVVHQIREDLSEVRNDQAAMRKRMEQLENQRQERDRDA